MKAQSTSTHLKLCKRTLSSALLPRLWLVAALASALMPAYAEVRYWTGSASGNWSNPNNWNPAGVPQNGDLLRFSGGANTSMLNDVPILEASELLFGDGNYVVNGNPIHLNSPFTTIWLQGQDCSATINCSVVLSGNSEFRVWPNSGKHGVLRINADIDLSGHDLTLLSFGPGGGGTSKIEIAGSISGHGDVTARGTGNPYGVVEFLGTADSTFDGTLYVTRIGANAPNGVYLNKQAGAAVTNRLVIKEAADLIWRNANQIGDNATVVISDGSKMDLDGYDETIGSLVLTNVSSDADPSLVDTVGGNLGPPLGTLTVNDGIVSWSDNASVVPTIKGRINLPAGGHAFFVYGPNYAGLEVQAEIAGLGGFSKLGNSALLLKGTNSFGGTVYGLEGIMDVYQPKGFGSPAGGVELNGGSVTLRGLTISDEILTARGQLPVTVETSGSLLFSVGTSGWAGTIVLETNLVVGGADMILSGEIVGAGGLDFRTFGTAQLGGSFANTYSGKTLVRCPLLQLNKPLGVTAYAGALEVGGGAGGPYEVRWLNFYQNPSTPVSVYANGILNLNNQVENFGPLAFNGGTVQTGTGFFIAESTITANPATTSATMNGNLSLGVSPAYFIVSNGVAEPDLIINSAISGVNIIKQGQGNLNFTGYNTHSGYTSIQEGVLQADNSSAFGTLAGNTIVADGATIRLGGIDGMAEAFQLNGSGFQDTNGAFQVTVGGTMTGAILLSIPSTINVLSGGGLAINSVVSGTGPLTKIGPGNLFLAGSANNTYTSGTLVSAGALYLAKNPNFLAVPGSLTVGPATGGSPATARWANSGVMAASAGITVNANSLLDLNGNNQNISQLILNDGGDVQTGAGKLTFLTGGPVTVGSLSLFGSQASSSFSGSIGLPANGTLSFVVAPYGPGLPVGAPELDVSAAIPVPVENVNFERAGIYKSGEGELRLTGNNGFNGRVDVVGGTLTVGSATALGTSFDGTFIEYGARLALINGLNIINESLRPNSTNSAALDNRGGNNTWTGPIILARNTSVSVNQNWSLTASGVISGPGSLTKIGGGTLALSGAANNTHSGNTLVNEGTLVINKVYGFQAVPASLVIGQSSGGPAALVRHLNHDQVFQNITVNGTGLLDLNNFDEYAADVTLSGGGDVQTGTGSLYVLGANGLTVNPANNNPATITGRLGFDAGSRTINVASGTTTPGAHDLEIPATIFQANPTVNLTKSGAGRARFSGTNTYTGTTTVSGGQLQIDGSQPQSPVQVLGARLQGGGIVGHVTFGGSAAQRLAPGSSPGILSCSNFNANAIGGGAVEIELNGGLPGSGYDQLSIRGTVNLSSLTLSPSLNSGSVVGQQFTIINNDGSDAVTGTFTGLPQNAKLYIGGELFQITYTGGTGNDVALTRLVTSPPPMLTIQQASPSEVRLTWPTNDPVFRLIASTNLVGSNWVAVAAIPEVVGTNSVVTNFTAYPRTFYRLINP